MATKGASLNKLWLAASPKKNSTEGAAAYGCGYNISMLDPKEAMKQ